MNTRRDFPKQTGLPLHYWFVMNGLLADQTGYWER
jgi:hypothetical protein